MDTLVEEEDSFNKSCPSSRRQLFLEDSPVKPGIDGKNIKSFEEFLDVSLQNLSAGDQDNLDQSIQESNITAPKRPFLKKGAGLVRFRPPPAARQRCCESINSLGDRENLTHQKFLRSSSGSDKLVELLPRTCSRTTSTVSSFQPGVFVSKRKPVTKKSSVPSSRNVNLIKDETTTSLENLERLLSSIRERKQQVLQQLDATQDDDSEWESEDDSEEDDDDELESLRELLSNRKSLVRNPTFTKKKVRWKKNKAALRSVLPSILKPVDRFEPLATATPGPYSLHLATCIGRLEEKLQLLKNRCEQQKETLITASEAVERSETSDTTTSNSSKEHQIKTTSLKNDITDINHKIQSLSEQLQTLQVLTEKTTVTKSNSNPKRTRVTVYRNPQGGKKEMIISKNLPSNDVPPNKAKSTTIANNKESYVEFENGCRMQVLADGTVVHLFPNGTKQSAFPDGSKLIEFPNGQTERCLTNGVKYISYPNSTHRIIHPDGSEEVTTSDGTLLTIRPDGTEIVILSNGDREIRSKEYNRREYRNGIIKTVYADGTQETRYPNGRLRIKDRMNNVLVESMVRTLHQI